MIVFFCYRCDTKLLADENTYGTAIACPSCATYLKVPALRDGTVEVNSAKERANEILSLNKSIEEMDQKLKTLTRENERLVTENNKWLEGSKATFDMKVKELAVLNADKGRETVLGAVKQVPVVSSAMCKYDVTSESKLKEDCSEITVTSESESKTNMTGKSDVSKTAVRIEFEEHVGKQGDDECVGDAVLFRNKVSSEALESDSGKYPYTSGLEKPEAVDLKANAPDEKIERHTDIPINLDGETRNRGLQNKATSVSNSALESWMQTTKVRLKKFKNTTSVGKDDLGRSDISG